MSRTVVPLRVSAFVHPPLDAPSALSPTRQATFCCSGEGCYLRAVNLRQSLPFISVLLCGY